ncbi:MAG: PRC-barrel domain-containing protein [Rubellimicrobium sp.]|nr:PRC-barrel domain-containing protein [Rubellimicrobium sp.]
MKKLLSTTAVIVALGFPAVTLAQTTDTTTAQTGNQMPGFLAGREQSDLFVSELMGRDVYARRMDMQQTDMAADDRTTDGQATMGNDGMRGMTMMNRADLDQMDNIGQIEDVVLSADGQVRAIIIGVGGFLGMGQHDVAVTMDQVSFGSDPDDSSQMYVVVNTGADLLQGSPAYDRTGMGHNEAQGDQRMGFTPPDLQRDGYNRVDVSALSTENLMGSSVYGVNDKDVGTVTDMILDESGAITHVIIDFGGFLGMGVKQASLGFDELTILATEGGGDVRLYVDATAEQIQSLQEYQAAY